MFLNNILLANRSAAALIRMIVKNDENFSIFFWQRTRTKNRKTHVRPREQNPQHRDYLEKKFKIEAETNRRTLQQR